MPEFGNNPTLRSYLVVLQRRKWWIITLALLGLATSLAISLTQPKQYSATAQLLVQSAGQGVSLGSSAQQVTTTDVQTDQQLATSAPVVQMVRKKLHGAPTITTSEVAQTNMIALTATSSTPDRAASVANTYAEAFVTETRNVAINNVRAAQEQISGEIKALNKQIESLQGRPKASAQVTALINQQAALKEEVAQLQINGAAATNGLEFVTPAQAPTSPSSPRPTQDALLGLTVGLILGLVGAFLRDNLDDALSSKEAAERLSGAPVLAMVPMVNSWKKRGRAVVAATADPTSPAAEAYRSLRTSLQFARHSQELRTILITSPAAAEGKTSTVANLGSAFAQTGERVVLVSCDLRRPQLGQLFGVNEKSGLTTVLLGQQTLEQALQPVRGYDCLWMLSAGPIPPNPAELLNSEQAREVFETLQENFDLVLVDSPPVLPVTDAMVLSQYANGTLLVVAAGQTRRTQLRRAAERFLQARIALTGIVLNEVSKQTSYSDEYGYSYSHYDSDVMEVPQMRSNKKDFDDSPTTDKHTHRLH